MKKLLLFTCALFLLACDDSEDCPCKYKTGISGTWELTRQEGYEISEGSRNEWSEKSADFDATYLFNCDHSGSYTYYEHFDNNEHSATEPIQWEYNDTGKTLAVTFTEAEGDMKIYTVESVSDEELILVLHTTQQDYEYYNRETYSKKPNA